MVVLLAPWLTKGSHPLEYCMQLRDTQFLAAQCLTSPGWASGSTQLLEVCTLSSVSRTDSIAALVASKALALPSTTWPHKTGAPLSIFLKNDINSYLVLPSLSSWYILPPTLLDVVSWYTLSLLVCLRAPSLMTFSIPPVSCQSVSTQVRFRETDFGRCEESGVLQPQPHSTPLSQMLPPPPRMLSPYPLVLVVRPPLQSPSPALLPLYHWPHPLQSSTQGSFSMSF